MDSVRESRPRSSHLILAVVLGVTTAAVIASIWGSRVVRDPNPTLNEGTRTRAIAEAEIRGFKDDLIPEDIRVNGGAHLAALVDRFIVKIREVKEYFTVSERKELLSEVENQVSRFCNSCVTALRREEAML
jgi:hypothetical protein